MSFQSGTFQSTAFQIALGVNPPGAISLLDNCVFTPTLGGLTDFAVAAAVLGSRTMLQAGAVSGNRYPYVARSADQTQWEGGLGTCRGDYISRDLVLWSTNGGSLVNFSSVPTVSIDALAGNFGNTRTQRYVTNPVVVILPTDQIINCNISLSATCQLPTSASRNGRPLTFKDIGAQAFLNNITIVAASGETIDGATTAILNSNRGELTLVPLADGINNGWFIS